MKDTPNFESNIWLDEPQKDDPFTAEASYCHGFDVFAQLIHKASFSDYILMMFTGNRPSSSQSKLFETLAVAMANLGPRDASIRAAMNAAVGGAPAASSLIASLAIGAGQTGGTRETYFLSQCFQQLGTDQQLWLEQLIEPNKNRLREDIWDEFEHSPGFRPHGVKCPKTLLQLLTALNNCGDFSSIKWLSEQRETLEREIKAPMGHTFICAAVFSDLGLSPEQAEICALLLSLPGAAVHALEAKQQGWRKFPFFGQSVELTDDPGVIAPLPVVEELTL
jgi:citrate synthase